MNICRFKHVYKKGKKGLKAEMNKQRKYFLSAIE